METLDVFTNLPSCWAFMGFYGSQISPQKDKKDFDIKRHTCRGDVILHPPRANNCIEMDKNATNRRIQPGYTPACYTKGPFVPSGRFQSHVASITHYVSR